MSITGNLKTMQLAELLQWLSHGNKTGTLLIDDGRVRKQIHFKKGRIFSSASSDPKEYLGHFLVSHGLITEQELSQAIEMQERTGMLLGKILATIGVIEESKLHQLLRLKAEESIFQLFTWEEAEFRFLDDEVPAQALIPLDLDVTGITLEGVRRLDEWTRIRQAIPSNQAIPVSVAPLDDPSRSQGERQVLQLVDDCRTVEEIALQTHASEFFVCRVLFDAYEAGKIKVVKPRLRIPLPSTGGGTDDFAVLGARALLEAARSHLETGRYDHAVRHLRAARSLEPDNREITDAVDAGEKTIKDKLEKDGVRLTAVPRLSSHLEDLTASKISPQEGFMLTRINGSYDIQSIVKISPMPQIDALLVFWRLHKAGHITLEEPRASPKKG
jgi:hypothetical protein